MAVILSTGLSFWYFKRHFNAFFKEPVAQVYERKKFFAFCWPLFFADLFIVTEAWISLFILGFFLSSEDVGIFSAAYKTTLLIQGILMSFNIMFSPIISGLHRSQEFEKIRTLFQIISRWVFSLSIPPILILIIFSKEILQLFGQSFVLGSSTLIILSLAQLLNSATGPLGGMIDMSGRTRITLLNALLNLLVHSVLCFFLIPRYGVPGAALARLTSVFLLRTARLIQVYIIWKMYPFRADFFKPLMAGAVSGLCLMFLKNALADIFPSLVVLLSGILLFAGIYTAAVLVMGIPQEDKKVWEMVKKKLKGMDDIR